MIIQTVVCAQVFVGLLIASLSLTTRSGFSIVEKFLLFVICCKLTSVVTICLIHCGEQVVPDNGRCCVSFNVQILINHRFCKAFKQI